MCDYSAQLKLAPGLSTWKYKFSYDHWSQAALSSVRGRTYVRVKRQNLNFYLETPHNIHATPHNIYFIRLRILPIILGTLYWRVDDPLVSKLVIGRETVWKCLDGYCKRQWVSLGPRIHQKKKNASSINVRIRPVMFNFFPPKCAMPVSIYDLSYAYVIHQQVRNSNRSNNNNNNNNNN